MVHRVWRNRAHLVTMDRSVTDIFECSVDHLMPALTGVVDVAEQVQGTHRGSIFTFSMLFFLGLNRIKAEF